VRHAPLALIALLVLAGCPPAASEHGAPAAAPAPIKAAAPGKRDVARRIVLPAELWAWQRVLIVAKVTGYLSAVPVDRGSAVKQGDLLATIAVPELQDERDRVAKEVETGEAELASAKAQHDLQALIVARVEGLLADKAATAQDADEARAKELVGRAAIDQATARLAAARERLKSADTWLAYSRVTAPFAGVVTDRWVHPGALVSAAEKTPLFQLTDNATIRAVIDVPEADCTRLTVGETKARIALAELGGAFEGVVSRAAAALDAKTRTRRIEVDLANEKGRLLPGMYGQATLELEVHRSALVVPRTALLATSDGPAVFVVSGGRAHRTPVQLGLEDGDAVEVVSGLAESDQVASVALGLGDGAPVTLAARAP